MKPLHVILIGAAVIFVIGAGALYFTADTEEIVQVGEAATAAIVPEPGSQQQQSSLTETLAPLAEAPASPSLYLMADGQVLPSPFAEVPKEDHSLAREVTMPIIPDRPIPLRDFTPANLQQENIKVIAVIPSSKSGQAILTSNSEQVIVNEGEQSQWGKIGKITQQGIYIDERFYSIDGPAKESSLPIIKSNLPIPAFWKN